MSAWSPSPRESRRVYYYSFGILRNKSVRKLLRSHGYRLRIGLPWRKNDAVLVWGRKSVSRRGLWIAERFHRQVITIEDSFLRSVKSGREGEKGQGIVLDTKGIYFQTDGPSDLFDLLDAAQSLSDDALVDAKRGIETLRALSLSKYNNFPMALPDWLPQKFVLVIDQTRRDASIFGGGVGSSAFDRMLEAAITENPEEKILIKTHPETVAGKKKGHFGAVSSSDKVLKLKEPANIWALFERATKVYVVTSQLGLEAIFAGHRPIVFGRAFYSGRGLSDDRHPDVIPKPPLKPEHFFWAAFHKYALYRGISRKEGADVFSVCYRLHARARHQREARLRVFMGIRFWKKWFFHMYFPRQVLAFTNDENAALRLSHQKSAEIVAWAPRLGKAQKDLLKKQASAFSQIEDGFLRSQGLGANLIKPVSMAIDDTGIYFDPTRPSRLEALIAQSVTLPRVSLERANAMIDEIVETGLSKYNVGSSDLMFDVPKNKMVILVPGQVEDDASILFGGLEIRSNLALLKKVREEFPDSHVVFKPHPDVEAGLRAGGEIGPDSPYADHILENIRIDRALDHVDCVATITSLAGFEALLRRKKVICYGAPFYAGWGLTDDRGWSSERRKARPNLSQLAHAVLIDYPLYWDPLTSEACSPEDVILRFRNGGLRNRAPTGRDVLARMKALLMG